MLNKTLNPSNDQIQYHVVGIDGLRGVAALAVMLYHCDGLIPHGYLAVDFFFGLSGYVLSLTYEKRFQTSLRLLPYLRLRLERLYPMIILGVLVGLILSPINSDAVAAINQNAHLFWWGLLAQLLVIPLPYPPGVFIFNGPQWSLFF